MKIFVFAVLACALLLGGATGCSGEKRSADSLLDQAYTLAMNGNWMQARSAARAAVKKAPDSVVALLMDAVVSERCGDVAHAVEAARKAVKLQPDHYLTWHTLGRLLARNPAADEESIAALRKALSHQPSDRNTLVLLTNVYMRANSDQAINCLLELSSRHQMQGNADLQNQIGIYYARRNNPRSAGPAFARAYNAAPDNPRIALNMARFVDHYQNSPRRALFFYDRYLDLTVKEPMAAPERDAVKKRVCAIRR